MSPEKKILKITDIDGFPLESAEKLEKSSELVKIVLAQNQEEIRLFFVLNKSTVSIELMDLLANIGNSTKIPWTFIPNKRENVIESRYQKATCLFSKESDSKPLRHPIV